MSVICVGARIGSTNAVPGRITSTPRDVPK
jgi:hypothetical protein